jgi:cellulose synthase/poly-beta-1,6-N-acetylglucosamine synthase-like glycosyltransferase
MLSNDYNFKILNNKVSKEDSSEISILTNEILNKNNYYDEKNNDNKNILKIIFFSIIIILILILLIYCPISNDYYKIKLKTEIIKIEEYFKICDDGILLNKKKFKKTSKPKISIISAVYNKQKFILRFLRSIQNQNYDQFEIILIDDFSEDNTVNIIEKYQKEDKRIILIKHKKNKGTLISRNEGIIISRGKYILIPDADDIISNVILKQRLKKAEENKYDMIRFITYLNNNNFLI